MKNVQILNAFHLRLIAIITMIIDHIALALVTFGYIEFYSNLNLIFRVIGRIAFPLFALGIVEGIIHTSNPKKYFLKLFSLLIAMTIGYIFVLYVMKFKEDILGNIYLDLILGASIIYFLNLKNKFSYFALIPIIITACLQIPQIPSFLTTQYNVYGVLMIVGMYGSYQLANKFSLKEANKNGLDFQIYQETPVYRNSINIAIAAFVIFLNLLYYILSITVNDFTTILNYNTIQDYSIISIIFIMLYNGKRGYNAKWYKIVSYLVYPVHLIVIFGIFYLLSL